MKFLFWRALILAGPLAAAPATLLAWGPTGHAIVNQAALASLPDDFPAWARTGAGAERVVFLSSEPDRWRSSKDEMFLHSTTLDHHFDLEEIADAGLDLSKISQYRYEFAVQFAAARAAHAGNFRPLEARYNADHTGFLPGFLPWAAAEDYGKLQMSFSELKVYQKYGTAEEIANARTDILNIMGIMGHWVGDGSQPLHVSKYFAGWYGSNPHGFINRSGWHAWIDSGFIGEAGITAADILPKIRVAAPLDLSPRPDGRDPVFDALLDYLVETNRQVVPLYQLEKDGPLRMNGPATEEGRAFIDGQLQRGAQMLGDLWLTAWRHAGPDFYLQSELVKRNAAAQSAAH